MQDFHWLLLGLVIVALDVTDGPTTVVATALIACAAAATFLAGTERIRLRATARCPLRTRGGVPPSQSVVAVVPVVRSARAEVHRG